MKTKKIMAAVAAAAIMMTSVASVNASAAWKETTSGKQYISNGKAVTGFVKISGTTYYFNSKGIMKTGWLKFTSGKTYYFDENGAMLTGFQNIDGKNYCFGTDGVMVTNTTKTYTFDENGVATEVKSTSSSKSSASSSSSSSSKTSSSSSSKTTSTAKTETVYAKEIVIDDEISMTSNGTKVLKPDLLPVSTTERTLTFSTTSKIIELVEPNNSLDKGKTITVKALSKGTAYVTITAEGESGTIKKTVKIVITQ